MKYGDPLDPKGLIEDAYQIEEITEAQCRSIFLDWALSLPFGKDSSEAIRNQLSKHEARAEGHPMTGVLQEGLQDMGKPKRRGGWRSRPRD
ncbi:MAG: hypothetical protein GJ676_03580 [Rhodobacteraceae bacterium]|nr:hypothetical protein [Paracoccaceae bacterium]